MSSITKTKTKRVVFTHEIDFMADSFCYLINQFSLTHLSVYGNENNIFDNDEQTRKQAHLDYDVMMETDDDTYVEELRINFEKWKKYETIIKKIDEKSSRRCSYEIEICQDFIRKYKVYFTAQRDYAYVSVRNLDEYTTIHMKIYLANLFGFDTTCSQDVKNMWFEKYTRDHQEFFDKHKLFINKNGFIIQK